MILSNSCKSDIEKITGKDIVFEQTNNRLESAVSFSQYIVDCSVLVTLIGERHDKTFKCHAPSCLTITEYCVNAANRNPNCRIILEYYCGGENIKADVPVRMNSDSIKNTYKQMKKNKIEKQIIPLDYRPFFLTRNGQDDLYGDGWFKYKHPKKIIEDFIDPFWKGSDKFSMKNPHLYSKTVIEFLHSYYLNICSVFKKVKINLYKNDINLSNIRRELFDAWKLVADYFIIRKILKKRDALSIDEYILVVGEAHRVNIDTLFNKLPHLVKRIGDTQFGKEGRCVKLYQSLRFHSVNTAK